ncbi:hypothetical protein [Nesterenkonia halotolerans]|uniref:Uncharacterized protein n=1 Tax=Nesterenkonia halotolerans TaxID=225325 RepID=A0ABR9J5Y4_9MICC|nr:hypothetical protein [Nesterenkonia halotolerans]MBE1514411.1 hypothetical protein [Nesterenkonia halotolerans]
MDETTTDQPKTTITNASGEELHDIEVVSHGNPAPSSSETLTDRAHGESELMPQRYDQMAKAASAGLMAHKDVETAIVEISGESQELVFHLTCTLVADIDPSAVMELITHGVIPNVERMLGESFASRDLQFGFAPSTSAVR